MHGFLYCKSTFTVVDFKKMTFSSLLIHQNAPVLYHIYLIIYSICVDIVITMC